MFQVPPELNIFMPNSGNKVRLQKLVKKRLNTHVGRVLGSITYCEGEASTNLSSSVISRDYVLKHPETDTMLSSAYVKGRKLYWTVMIQMCMIKQLKSHTNSKVIG